MTRWLNTSLLAAAAAVALAEPLAAQPASDATANPPQIAPMRQTEATAQAGANGAVVWLQDGAPARLVGTGALGGLEVYDLDGKRLSAVDAGEAVGVDLRYGVPFGGRNATLFAAADARTNSLRFYEGDATGLHEVSARPVPVGFGLESMCLYRSPADGVLYAYALGGAGEVGQFAIFAAPEGKLDARPVRMLHLASEASYCVADDVSGDLYVAEQAVGIWRFDADPEAEVVPELIDARRLGNIEEEVGGLALRRDADGPGWLIASNASAGQLMVYDRAADHRLAGRFTVGVKEPTGLGASALPQAGAPGGVLLVTDEGETEARYRLVALDAVGGALGLTARPGFDPRAAVASPVPTVTASLETRPVETDGDAADDPAIWIDPVDPGRSLVIGTQKQSGLYVYDLSGEVVQFLPDGKMNNVDLRDGFRLGGQAVSIVAASNRTTDSIAIYRVDAQAHRLVDVADGLQATGLTDPYGLCLYTSRRTRKTYVFINDTNGQMRQWELVDAGGGKVRVKLVREWRFDSQADGCVADDETGALYVNEEDVGLWRMNAEPRGTERRMVAAVADNPALKDDLEGIGIYDAGAGRGYLVLSSQGNNTYAVYRREGDNAYVGSFAVVADPATGIDGISETDGLEVTSRSLGSAYPRGAMIAQDGRNVGPQEHQNFKIVSWEAIAAKLGL
jgi:3-phytase